MIPVCWHEGKDALFSSDGEHGRYRYWAANMLNEMFESYDCYHWSEYQNPHLAEADGAVVLICGGHEKDLVDKINDDISHLKWCLLIGFSDEESLFPYHRLKHRNKKLWIQSPIPSNHNFADRFILFGPGKYCKKFLTHAPRDLDWSFSGQVTHDRRREMVEQAKKLSNGFLVETQGFGQGLAPEEYFSVLSRSKIVLCPTGPASPDSFRFAEALEYGCIPIVDEKPSWKKDFPPGFWQMMFPNRPFPVVQDWSELPRIVNHLLSNYEQRQQACVNWWREYKQEYFNWLGRDLYDLGAFNKERGSLLAHLR